MSSSNIPQRKVVVIVDDDQLQRYIFTNLLRDLNVIIKEAENGRDALDLIAATHVDLVLTDNMMPTMNGEEMILKLRSSPATAHIPIIMVTGASINLGRMKPHVNALFIKPIQPSEFLETVKKFLL